jgi:DUF971 family protein
VETIPVGISANRNTNILTISWKDGHTSDYPSWLLRFSCPCAECRGGHDQMSATPPPGVFELTPEDTERTRIENVEAVGSYAISIFWQDGHSAGIFNWDYLRLLCPCSACHSGG